MERRYREVYRRDDLPTPLAPVPERQSAGNLHLFTQQGWEVKLPGL